MGKARVALRLLKDTSTNKGYSLHLSLDTANGPTSNRKHRFSLCEMKLSHKKVISVDDIKNVY